MAQRYVVVCEQEDGTSWWLDEEGSWTGGRLADGRVHGFRIRAPLRPWWTTDYAAAEERSGLERIFLEARPSPRGQVGIGVLRCDDVVTNSDYMLRSPGITTEGDDA